MKESRETIAAQICVILQEHLGLPSSRLISEDEDFYDDLGGDSLDMAEVVMKCEEEFDIEIPDPDSPVRKIGEIIDVAVKCLKKSGPVCS